MRVYCEKIVRPADGQEVTEFSGIRIGGEYTVLEILAIPGHSPRFRIITDDGTPGLWDSEMFITVSSRIPSNWVATVGDGGILRLRPKPWLERDFWENYFDRDPQAEAVFEKELETIMAES